MRVSEERKAEIERALGGDDTAGFLSQQPLQPIGRPLSNQATVPIAIIGILIGL